MYGIIVLKKFVWRNLFMNIVQLSEIYPVQEIKLASELLYVCELAKYFYIHHQTQLSIDGVVLNDSLKKSRYWAMYRVAVTNEWLTNAVNPQSVAVTELNPVYFRNVSNILVTEEPVTFNEVDWKKRQEDLQYDRLTPVPVQVFFSSIDSDKVVWTKDGLSDDHSITHSTSFFSKDASQRLTSLVAYVAVERFFSSNPFQFVFNCDSFVAHTQLAMADIVILIERTNALDNWFVLKYTCGIEAEKRIGYEAWWFRGYELGYLSKEYEREEKIAYAKQLDLKVGDVICYFERDASHKNNYVKEIKSSNFAIIKEITKKGITISRVLTMKLPYQRKKEFDALKMSEKAMFGGKYKTDSFSQDTMTIEWNELGVEYAMYDELKFITPVQLDSRTTMPVMSKKELKEVLVEVDAANFIYWILSEYEVEFNKERFDARYLNGNKPTYERWLDAEF